MKLKNFFSDPKVMACSGLLAMVPKLLITSLIMTVIILLTKKPRAAGAVFIVIYPIVGTMLDVTLHLIKDQFWHKLPTNIPADWAITAAQLLAYAKYLPKVRLMRFCSCWMLLPFITFDKDVLLLTISALAVGFFVAALFDWLWLKIFNIKKPKFPIRFVNSACQHNLWDIDMDRLRKEVASNSDSTAVGSPAWYSSKENDPCTVGSSAWYASRHFD